MAVVTSSGFFYQRRGGTIVLCNCPRNVAAAAELEYLREVEPKGLGRIRSVERTSEEGREVHVVSVELPGGAPPHVVTFDVGPALLGRLRNLHEALGLLVFGLAGATALGTIGYLVSQLVGPR